MFNKKPIDDWATPKAASTRSSPSVNDPLLFIKKGMKSGSKVTGDAYLKDYTVKQSKEHVIDSSFYTPQPSVESIEYIQSSSFPPRSDVQMSKATMSAPANCGGKTPTDGFWATMTPQYRNTMRQKYGGFAQNSIENIPELATYNDSRGKAIEELNSLNTVKLGFNNQNVTASVQSIPDYNGRYLDADASSRQVTSAQYLQSIGQRSEPSLINIKAVASSASLTPVSCKGSVNFEGAGKWDHVMNAKDDLIKQKDLIIARQKQTIEQLQYHIADIEERINQNSYRITAQRKDDEKIKEQLNNSECQVAQLRAQLLHVTSNKQEEIENLQKKLGATEYELQKLEKGFKDVGRGQAKEVAELNKKIEERNATHNHLRASLETLQSDLQKERRKAQSLQQYLQELPTAEEHSKSLQQIKDVKSKNLKLEEKIQCLEERIRELKNNLKQKHSLLEKENLSKDELTDEIKRLKDQLDRYKEREREGPITMEEFDEAKWEGERLKQDCDRLKKLLTQKHKKMENLHQQSQATVKALEERLGQEENTVNVLRKDIESKELIINDMKRSVKQFADKNQDLMKKNLELQDLLQELEKLTSTEVREANHQVHKELGQCVSEIRFLIDLCSQIAQGQDPNISALLGIKVQTEVPVKEDGTFNPFGIDSAKTKLKRIRELRSEIDKLRTFVSDKYAEEVGNNCITQ